jgi:hypothetical protein
MSGVLLQKLAALAGLALGIVLAPLFALWSRIKGARVLHTQGLCVKARVLGMATEGPGPVVAFAQSLAGEAVARFSLGLTRASQPAGGTRNILGLGLVLGAGPACRHLLFATFESFGAFGRGRDTTVTTDFLANTYYVVAPLALDGAGLVRLRARPVEGGRSGAPDRATNLAADLRAGTAVLALELSSASDPTWVPIARLTLEASLEGAGGPLSPWRTGPGLHAVGFLAGLRRIIYPVAQWARGARPDPMAAESASPRRVA